MCRTLLFFNWRHLLPGAPPRSCIFPAALARNPSVRFTFIPRSSGRLNARGGDWRTRLHTSAPGANQTSSLAEQGTMSNVLQKQALIRPFQNHLWRSQVRPLERSVTRAETSHSDHLFIPRNNVDCTVVYQDALALLKHEPLRWLLCSDSDAVSG